MNVREQALAAYAAGVQSYRDIVLDDKRVGVIADQLSEATGALVRAVAGTVVDELRAAVFEVGNVHVTVALTSRDVWLAGKCSGEDDEPCALWGVIGRRSYLPKMTEHGSSSFMAQLGGMLHEAGRTSARCDEHGPF